MNGKRTTRSTLRDLLRLPLRRLPNYNEGVLTASRKELHGSVVAASLRKLDVLFVVSVREKSEALISQG